MKKPFIYLLFLLATTQLYAERTMIRFNEDWSFRFSHNVAQKVGVKVNLPHTWNAQDALSGKLDYKRGIGNYDKTFFVPKEWKGKRVFIRFEGVNTIANVFLNGKHLGEHRGGYTAFVFELSGRLNYGENNNLQVRVNNAEQLDVMPLLGDFNFYGGIYRDVYLMLTDQVCISPLDLASPGVYLKQSSVTDQLAKVQTRVLISNTFLGVKQIEVELKVKADEQTIVQERRTINLTPAINATELSIPITINKPHLWNGQEDPFIYQVEVNVLSGNQLLDQVIQPLGLRYFKVDNNKGFSLNGKPLRLRGICRHQDRAEIGNALLNSHHDEDVAIMLEMGVNAIRLSHYPHAPYFFDLLDKNGFVTWSEIPFVGPGGYADGGFVDQESFKQNGRQQLKEMIRQNYNHPSICFWGLFNELKEVGDNPFDYITELNKLAYAEDSTRITTAASNIMGEINKISTLIAWNRYDGWYENQPNYLGQWLDKTHAENPKFNIGISEYGAGSSVNHQQDTLVKSVPNSSWHPENWQTYFHMENWKAIAERQFVWGSFIWNLFDFGAAHRNEGDRPGINDKGLVSFDRKIKKDAFYFYKANWNKKVKTVYLSNKRDVWRKSASPSVMVFANTSEVELIVNGKSYGKKSPDNYATIVWKNINLVSGKNKVIAKSKINGQEISDACEWIVEDSQVRLVSAK